MAPVWWLRIQRGRLVGHNPLVRRSDRVAVWLAVAAVVAAVLAAPVAIRVGAVVEKRAVAAAEHQLRTRHRVPVTTLGETRTPLSEPDPGAVTVIAHWSWHGHHHGRIAVPTGTPKGAQLLRWVDDQGRLVGAPVSIAEAKATTPRVALAVWALFVSALYGLGRIVRTALIRAREQRWSRDLEKFLRSAGH